MQWDVSETLVSVPPTPLVSDSRSKLINIAWLTYHSLVIFVSGIQSISLCSALVFSVLFRLLSPSLSVSTTLETEIKCCWDQNGSMGWPLTPVTRIQGTHAHRKQVGTDNYYGLLVIKWNRMHKPSVKSMQLAQRCREQAYKSCSGSESLSMAASTARFFSRLRFRGNSSIIVRTASTPTCFM